MHIKVSEQGNIIEVTRLSSRNRGSTIRKINADEYLVCSEQTGEIHTFERSENRSDSKKSLYQTFRKLRAIINTNCVDADCIRWVTLTYAENMQDKDRLYTDYRDFWKRFKRRWPGAEYIVVAEPQGRGAWHMHCLFIYHDKAPFIPNVELASVWGHGFVNVKSLDNIDNVGAYLSAYLGDAVVDVEVPREVEGLVSVKDVREGDKVVQKRIIKGGRLHLYPPGMNIYRCSRGVRKPVESWVNPYEAEEIINGATLTYKNSVEFETEDGFKQTVVKEYYNKVR